MSISEYKSRYLESLYNKFKTELENEHTHYFILDTNYTNNNDDQKEFETYTWDVQQYNKIREGDLFILDDQLIYLKLLNNFIFGAGKIEKLSEKIM